MHVARCLLPAACCMLSSCMLSSTRVLCTTGTPKATVGLIGIPALYVSVHALILEARGAEVNNLIYTAITRDIQ